MKCGNGIVQNGTGEYEECFTMAAAGKGPVVLAGKTKGNWSGTSAGHTDFAAVKLDANGTEVWRWQVSHAVYLAREVVPIILMTALTICFVQLSMLKTCIERYSYQCPSGIDAILYLIHLWSGHCNGSD